MKGKEHNQKGYLTKLKTCRRTHEKLQNDSLSAPRKREKKGIEKFKDGR